MFRISFGLQCVMALRRMAEVVLVLDIRPSSLSFRNVIRT